MTMKEIIAAVVGGARSSVQQVHDAAAKITGALAAKMAHRQWLHVAPAPFEDLLAAGVEMIAADGAKWRATHGPGLRACLTGDIIEPDGGLARVVRHATLTDALGPRADWGADCALDPDRVRALLAATITRPEGEGPSMASRPHLIADADRGIAELEQEHTQMVDAAAELGVSIPYLEAVEARRRVAAHQAERLEEQRERDARANAGSVRRRG